MIRPPAFHLLNFLGFLLPLGTVFDLRIHQPVFSLFKQFLKFKQNVSKIGLNDKPVFLPPPPLHNEPVPLPMPEPFPS